MLMTMLIILPIISKNASANNITMSAVSPKTSHLLWRTFMLKNTSMIIAIIKIANNALSADMGPPQIISSTKHELYNISMF